MTFSQNTFFSSLFNFPSEILSHDVPCVWVLFKFNQERIIWLKMGPSEFTNVSSSICAVRIRAFVLLLSLRNKRRTKKWSQIPSWATFPTLSLNLQLRALYLNFDLHNQPIRVYPQSPVSWYATTIFEWWRQRTAGRQLWDLRSYLS